ncbi:MULTISPECIES: endonuclease MutS2 [unclassified Arcicella]|uniref:endonuclease MutS2 n=1 Tax=unclassified Arcicella TaxID=2644986 RepID=UPI002863E738|nr:MULTISPECIES: Smr/MutS family protein [unclassified Arcicella]MDR6563218.1 DNA mismatch repair protein MutS2 [Arcicella sp. BE51]MDR6811631.1 DNA mismatch repair protein MutS2 [Arcicella sp. BE140]MDR6823157.1 DNA mismatch repair protein MutS2 [Arcicella sp. BE139]
MLYPQNIEQKLGFDRIREHLNELCVSSLGRAFVNKIRFADNYDLIQKMIRQVAEMKDILQFEPQAFPAQNYLDVNHQLSKAAIEGAFLTEEEFFDLKLSLRTIQECLRFFDNKEPEAYPQLRELVGTAFSADLNLRQILDSLDKVIDDRGKLKDNASPELQAIRRRIQSQEIELRKKLESILKMARSNGWISDDFSLTLRGGRMVIPIAAEHKRKIKGFVHDESDTGKTVFMEPTEVLEANNEIRELESAERREIIRILMELTTRVRPHVPVLRKAYTFLGIIDFIRAKARLAIEINGIAPLSLNSQIVDWKNAVHPLLFLSFKKQGKKVQPLSITLDSDQRILLISGPNAGGKSVTLKTLGLVQYMYQCGLLVPMAEHSTIGIFRSVFIDIGDEQSLENDLSTYSSHLTNMKYFLINSDRKTLFLIDEFGTGTEPTLGGAIAESILEDLNRSGAYGAINTHYTNLKTFADRTKGLVNGAMRYDAEHLEPLYELEIGKPGSSFAIEIAYKIGLPKAIIDKSKQKIGNQQVSFEKLIKELEIEKKVFADKNVENAQKQRKLDQLLEQYNSLKTYLDTEKKTILNTAKVQAKELIKNTNQKIEATIKEIREQGAEKLATKEIRQDLVDFQESLVLEKVAAKKPSPKEEKEKEEREEIEVILGEISVGSLVRIKGQEALGEVLSLRGKDAEIAIGDLKTTVKINRLEKISRKEFKQRTTSVTKIVGVDMNDKLMNFSFNLDLRGKRGEEALVEVDKFMNDAIMVGYNELRIVHGKGDGILRNLIRQHLRGYKQVANTQDEHADRGGAGVTLVSMK